MTSVGQAATPRVARLACERNALRHRDDGEGEQDDPDDPHSREEQQAEEGDRGD
jgi:hypothetical protein